MKFVISHKLNLMKCRVLVPRSWGDPSAVPCLDGTHPDPGHAGAGVIVDSAQATFHLSRPGGAG